MIKKGLFVVLAVLVIFLVAPIKAGDQDFTLVNNTGVVIHEFYVSAHTTNEWEEDILGVDTLADEEEVAINFSHEEDECAWDMMIVDGEGTKVTWSNINLCEHSTITLHLENGKAWATFE